MNKRIIKLIAIFFAISSLIGCTKTNESPLFFEDSNEMVANAKSRVQSIDSIGLTELRESGQMFLLIDVRTREEHDAGYIPGSVLLPRGLLEFRILNDEFWDEEGLYSPLKDELIILYCRSGNRSALAAESLEKLGFSNVYTLTGGFNGWKDSHPDMIEINLPPVNPGLVNPATEDDSGSSC